MAELACVYDAVPVPRAPEDIISSPAQKRRKKKAQAAASRREGEAAGAAGQGKWLTASVTDDIPAVIAAAFDEADRRDPGHARMDRPGGRGQQPARPSPPRPPRRGITLAIVIDFIHVLEYLWKAAWCFPAPGDPAMEDWVIAQALDILHGRTARTCARIRRRAEHRGYRPASTPRSAAKPRPTCRTSRPSWTTRGPWRTAGRSPPASSRAPAATWSRTGWFSAVGIMWPSVP